MAVNLTKGQRVSLDKGMTMALIGLGWDPNRYDGGYDFDLDASAFLLGKNGKVLRDEDFVFYHNLEARDGAVCCLHDSHYSTVIGALQAIDALESDYSYHRRGITLKRFGQHIQLTTRAEYAPSRLIRETRAQRKYPM